MILIFINRVIPFSRLESTYKLQREYSLQEKEGETNHMII